MKRLEIRLQSHWNLFLVDCKSPFVQNIGLAAWQHQAITWSKVDLSSNVFCDIYPDMSSFGSHLWFGIEHSTSYYLNHWILGPMLLINITSSGHSQLNMWQLSRTADGWKKCDISKNSTAYTCLDQCGSMRVNIQHQLNGRFNCNLPVADWPWRDAAWHLR